MDKLEVKKNFSDNLYALLYQNNTTIAQLSEYCGAKQKTMSSYARQRALPKPELMQKIANFFDVSPQYLIENHRGNTNESRISILYNKLSPYDQDILLSLAEMLVQKHGNKKLEYKTEGDKLKLVQTENDAESV